MASDSSGVRGSGRGAVAILNDLQQCKKPVCGGLNYVKFALAGLLRMFPPKRNRLAEFAHDTDHFKESQTHRLISHVPFLPSAALGWQSHDEA